MEVHIGATWQIRLNRPYASAMRPSCQITLTACYCWTLLFCAQMSDMQRNFDEQLFGKESEMSSRLDNMSQKHDCELSGVQMYSHYFFCHLVVCF